MGKLTENQMEKIITRFKEYDNDDDGVITESELTKILGDYLTDSQIKDMFSKMDTNEDGRVSLDEFKQANS
ncbi:MULTISPECIES: EF-hand domain-containing protein [unclassified Burkholderia]|uniref:EF-hand domain-containing protein n=1 Tax=unclassified Burkholderia TaxID=2613784 RepID=UPI000AEE3856|nr:MULTISPECIES: EF-hand domain-containing protein [unclassified Burkholderia]